MYDLGFGDLVGYVAYMYYPGWLVVGGFVEFDLKFFFISLKHIGLQKGQIGRTMGSPASRQPHALALAVSRTADKRPVEFNFAAKGRGAGRYGRTR